MSNHEKKVKHVTSPDCKFNGGFNRGELVCVLSDAKPKPVKDDMLFSFAYKTVSAK